MIISASRRTDIPAFYSEWFMNRLRAGFVYVKNPMNQRQISKIALDPKLVDCIAFWTKNAEPMLDKLDEIDSLGFKYYFQWTLTPYGKCVESKLPDKKEIVERFKQLSDKIGSHRMVWRYDPVIVSPRFTVEYHVHHFAELCEALSGYVHRCIFSYVDRYARVTGRTQGIVDSGTETRVMLKIAGEFSEIAIRKRISLASCAEQIELGQFGIGHASCIDRQTVEKIAGHAVEAEKTKGQREFCGCIASVDIGAYDSCAHGCIYCYATSGENMVRGKMKKHDVASPLLMGEPCPEDKITERVVKSAKRIQNSLFYLPDGEAKPEYFM